MPLEHLPDFIQGGALGNVQIHFCTIPWDAWGIRKEYEKVWKAEIKIMKKGKAPEGA